MTGIMTESLFSLEIHVESVDNLKVSCCIPAVSYRLLDFPSLIIHHVSPLMVDKLRDKSRMAGLGKNLVFPELRDRNGNFIIQKGKSCLFKANVNKLHQQLQVTPVYVMLVDLWPKKPKLIGSTVVSLKSAVDKIKADVEQNGVSVPSYAREEGTFDIYNLMGSRVGRIVLGFRLLSLGGTLIPHIPHASLMTKETDSGHTTSQLRQIDVPDHIPVEEPEPEGAAEEDDVDNPTEEKQDSQTQTENLATRSKETRHFTRQNADYDDVLITNTVCPPPLYYNIQSHTDNTGRNDARKSARHTISDDVTTSEVDYDYYEPGLVQPDGTCGCVSVKVQTDTPRDSNDSRTGKDDNQLTSADLRLENLPLLNALVKELSRLNAVNNEEEHFVPQISKKEQQEKPVATPRSCVACQAGVTDKPKSHKQPIGAVGRRSKPSAVVGLQKRVKFKKTNLTYGMTKTQLMRLRMNQKTLPENSRPESEPKSATRMGKEQGRTNTATEFGKTQVIVPQRNTETQAGNRDEDDSNQMSSTVVINKEQITQLSREPELNSSRSLVSQNSLDVYLPQISQESEGSESGSIDIPMAKSPPIPTPQSTKYGHTGIASPPPPKPVPRPRSNATNSPVNRSRASTALSMYSDDFEDSQHGESESNSSSVSSYHSVKSQSRTKTQREPMRSDMSPVKSKQQRNTSDLGAKHDNSNSSSSSSSSGTRSNSVKSLGDNPLKGNATVTLQSHRSTESIHKTESEGYSDEFHSVASDSGSYKASGKDVLNLPRPINELGYTY